MRRFLISLFVASALASGCTLIAEVDRSKIAPVDDDGLGGDGGSENGDGDGDDPGGAPNDGGDSGN